MRAFLFFILFFLSLSRVAQAQAPLDALNTLDTEAFSALESNSPKAEEKANALLTEAKRVNSALHQINAYTILGILHKNKGQYVSSVEFYNQALSIAERAGDQGRVSACYNNIGSVYQLQENYEKALFYFKKSLEIEDELKNPLQKSIRLYNLGEVYREMDSLTLALSHFNSSLIIEQKHENYEGIVYALLGISEIYLKLKRPADAGLSLDEAKKFLNKSGIETQILYHLQRGDVFLQQGKLDQAEANLDKARDLSEKNEFRIYLMDIYEKESDVKKARESQPAIKAEKRTTVRTYNFWLLILIATIIPLALLARKRRRTKKAPNSAHHEEEAGANDAAPLLFTLKNTNGKSLFKAQIEDIVCFEANDNYVIIYYLKNGRPAKSMERLTLRKVEQQLETIQKSFSRVHKSFLVNPSYVREVHGKSQAYRLRIEHLEEEVPVSRQFDISVFQ